LLSNVVAGIGPDVNGKFHPKAIEQLRQAGAWLKVNGEAIYATRSRPGDDWKEGDSLRFTQKKGEKTIYAISLRWPGPQLAIKTIKPEPETQIVMLGDTRPLQWNNDGGLTIELPMDQLYEASSPLGFAYVFRITDSATEPVFSGVSQ
jgi:alpha-L-fucosidase